MKIKQQLLVVLSTLALSTGVSAGEGNMGDHQWACQVTTSSGIFGLVQVWADTRDIASDVATRAQAVTMRDTREPVQNIIECIKVGGERFKDENFWTFYQRHPR